MPSLEHFRCAVRFAGGLQGGGCAGHPTAAHTSLVEVHGKAARLQAHNSQAEWRGSDTHMLPLRQQHKVNNSAGDDGPVCQEH
jgi:hypothetical protein